MKDSARVIETRHDRIQIADRRHRTARGVSWTRLFWIVLLLPSPLLPGPLMLSATQSGPGRAASPSEIEVESEDVKESVSLTHKNRRQRRGHSRSCHQRGDNLPPAPSKSIVRQVDRRVIVGHRIANGLLAPIRC